MLREAWQTGIVLAGISAGAICWFSHGVTDSFGAGLAGLDNGLGLIAGTFCPHYDGEVLRRPRFHELVGDGQPESARLPGGWACDNGAALVFEGTELREAVTARRDAAAYRLDLVGIRPRGGQAPGPAPRPDLTPRREPPPAAIGDHEPSAQVAIARTASGASRAR